MEDGQQERVSAASAVLSEYYREAINNPVDQQDPTLTDKAFMARFHQAQELAYDTTHQRPDLAEAAYATCRILGLEEPATDQRVLMMAILDSVAKVARGASGLNAHNLFQVLGISTASSSPE